MKKETLLFFGGTREGEYENLLKKGFNFIAVVDNYLPELPKIRHCYFTSKKCH